MNLYNYKVLIKREVCIEVLVTGASSCKDAENMASDGKCSKIEGNEPETRITCFAVEVKDNID